MSWTLTNLFIQIAGGLFGGLAIGTMLKDHSVGLWGSAAVGLLAGVLSGCLLQQVTGTIVTGAGAVNPSTAVEGGILQGLGGVASGACLALVIGLVHHAVAEHRARAKQEPR